MEACLEILCLKLALRPYGKVHGDEHPPLQLSHSIATCSLRQDWGELRGQ